MNIYMTKGFVKRPECPFCGIFIEKPKELAIRRPGEMPVGSCSCGAVYACDISGRNKGAALIEALVFSCDMDWDLAWSLMAGEDYHEQLVNNYDLDDHLIIPSGSFEGRKIRGSLYFVRLHPEIFEATGEGVRKKLAQATPRVSTATKAPLPAYRLSKKEVEELVRDYNIEPLLNAAASDKRIIRDMQRLLYSGDELFRLRASDSLGKVSAAIAEKDPGAIANLLQKLTESVSYPGASSWGAIDTIGEIVHNTPDLYMGYLSRLLQFLGDGDHRPRIFRAMARAAEASPAPLRNLTFRLLDYLKDPHPETRGYAAMLFGLLGAREAASHLEQITGDSQEINIYHEGDIERISVGRLAKEALEKIKNS